jgi:hypothetical protein
MRRDPRASQLQSFSSTTLLIKKEHQQEKSRSRCPSLTQPLLFHQHSLQGVANHVEPTPAFPVPANQPLQDFRTIKHGNTLEVLGSREHPMHKNCR